MYTLTIAQIFSQIEFYQENYLNILNTPESYFTEVEGAFVELFPFKKQNLLLGDLLQLWFSKKWLIHSSVQNHLKENTVVFKKALQRDEDLYLYQLVGSAVTGVNHSKVWSKVEHKNISVNLDSVFRNFCEFKGLSQPKALKDGLGDQYKKVV